ncbi:probably inactive leucine-rich repeat receptor-like protein kinase At5g48380 [Aristolochia californica]|uniref:probably inactive leucine-rich repeat receptor-like protein kinase At5g48380 n=1 Tax=Aristolochia californica TaxID=171875 RepID=UPI0035DC2A9A
MEVFKNTSALVFFRTLCLLSLCSVVLGVESDIQCLKALKRSLNDSFGYLQNWNFQNSTEGFICRFIGIECWHIDESRVITIKLSNMELKGQFPSGLELCTSMTGLDLSNNEIVGPLPPNISHLIPFVTNLDLSSNKLSGAIPENLANCTFLNTLSLQSNRLSGQIPWQFSTLNRLTTFNVANNNLSGPIPPLMNVTSPSSFANNPWLCGKIVNRDCEVAIQKSHTSIIIGSAVGGVIFAVLVVGIILYLCLRRVFIIGKKEDDPEGNKWTKGIRGSKGIKVSTFEKSVSKMKLRDLMKATDNFNKNNIIASGRTGSIYKGTLPDHSFLSIKRLRDSRHSEKEFMSEMRTLGAVKHRNLVPLLGVCIAKRERFLIYRHMPNGSLYHQLHEKAPGEKVLDWAVRLKVGIGAAKGLAWLHHSCNPRILHRNISSKCILLDDDYEPKISEFGLARLMNPVDTHLSTFVNGEFGDLGYVAPEYTRTLVATPKGDVYSFGVVLLELVTGETPTHVSGAPDSFKGSLAEWISFLSDNSVLQDAIDKSLIGKGCDEELLQFLRVACNCVLSVPKERPSMFEVYQLLRAIGERYDFSAEDELMMMPHDSGDADQLDELIVAQEKQGSQ